MGSDAIDGAGKLVIIVGKAANKVGQSVARIRVVASEIERAVVVEIVVEVFFDPADIRSKFESVPAFRPGKSILVLKCSVVNLGGTLWRRAEIERASYRDCGRSRAVWIIGGHSQKSECRGRCSIGWHRVERRNAVSGKAQLIQLGRR